MTYPEFVTINDPLNPPDESEPLVRYLSTRHEPLQPRSVEAGIYMEEGSDFLKKWGRKIKKLKGTYSECRGHHRTRYVKLPWTHEGLSLLDQILAARTSPNKKVNMHISQYPRDVQAWVVVHDACSSEELRKLYRAALQNAAKRGIVLEFEGLTDKEKSQLAIEALRNDLTFSVDGTPNTDDQDVLDGVALLEKERARSYQIQLDTIGRIANQLRDEPVGIMSMNTIRAHQKLWGLPNTKRDFDLALKLDALVEELEGGQ